MLFGHKTYLRLRC